MLFFGSPWPLLAPKFRAISVVGEDTPLGELGSEVHRLRFRIASKYVVTSNILTGLQRFSKNFCGCILLVATMTVVLLIIVVM